MWNDNGKPLTLRFVSSLNRVGVQFSLLTCPRAVLPVIIYLRICRGSRMTESITYCIIHRKYRSKKILLSIFVKLPLLYSSVKTYIINFFQFIIKFIFLLFQRIANVRPTISIAVQRLQLLRRLRFHQQWWRRHHPISAYLKRNVVMVI